MTKEQFVEQFVDKYEEAHPEERIDYPALYEKADLAWYDKEVEAGHATEHDLTKEQEKVAKTIRGQARAVNAYGKEVKRERKPNEVKRWIIERVKILCEGWELNGDALNVQVTNIERSIDFNIDGRSFTLTLTEHRKPKEGS